MKPSGIAKKRKDPDGELVRPMQAPQKTDIKTLVDFSKTKSISELDQTNPVHHHSYRAAVIAGLTIACVIAAVMTIFFAWKLSRYLARRFPRRHAMVDKCTGPTCTSTSLSKVNFFAESADVSTVTSSTVLNSPAHSDFIDSIETKEVQSPITPISPYTATWVGQEAMPMLNAPAAPFKPAAMCSSVRRKAHLTINTKDAAPRIFDHHAEQLSRAIESSPVLSAVLTESFDVHSVSRGRRQESSDSELGCGKRSFDWGLCKFEKDEEEAMWLPCETKPRSHSHQRSASDPSYGLSHAVARSTGTFPQRSIFQSFQDKSMPNLLTPLRCKGQARHLANAFINTASSSPSAFNNSPSSPASPRRDNQSIRMVHHKSNLHSRPSSASSSASGFVVISRPGSANIHQPRTIRLGFENHSPYLNVPGRFCSSPTSSDMGCPPQSVSSKNRVPLYSTPTKLYSTPTMEILMDF